MRSTFLSYGTQKLSSIGLLCDLISGLVKTTVNCDQTASLWAHLPNKPEACSTSRCQSFIPQGVLLMQESIFTGLVMLFRFHWQLWCWRFPSCFCKRKRAHSQGLWLCGTSSVLVVWNLKHVEQTSEPLRLNDDWFWWTFPLMSMICIWFHGAAECTDEVDPLIQADRNEHSQWAFCSAYIEGLFSSAGCWVAISHNARVICHYHGMHRVQLCSRTGIASSVITYITRIWSKSSRNFSA